ncbi:Outer membrane protein assembly factor BamD [Candidatus Bealeia paramacronuclearis]|uniref:Outer membrane protein assembly factor BamD n=1 Tax=Candidatus Bealeia paramacronuclearis TaxID=1921001 RepID=A0ABZ2CAL8_9PROT|nr:Outer membrane protein assembly factor BamD [Candidatus Bealeia paramacronuclearis]
MLRTRQILKPIALLPFVLLGACSPKEKPYVERPATELYEEGYKKLITEEYDKASEAFDEVERQHPYSEWATRGQLMAAYSSYINREFDKALATLNAFVELHPGHKDIAYAYYLRALCHYEEILSVKRDQTNTLESLKAFEEVIKRFPETKYGRDAKWKLDLVYDHLAGKEMDIGRFYMNGGLYLAAINRFQAVIDAYPRTTHVPEALHRLVECYLAMGLTEEAQVVAAVMGHNFPGNEWYGETFLLLKGQDLRPLWIKQQEGSWLDKLRRIKFF